MLRLSRALRFLRISAFAAAVAVVLAVYGFAASRAITLPGVYMDAVNPDYLVVKLLNGHHTLRGRIRMTSAALPSASTRPWSST